MPKTSPYNIRRLALLNHQRGYKQPSLNGSEAAKQAPAKLNQTTCIATLQLEAYL